MFTAFLKFVFGLSLLLVLIALIVAPIKAARVYQAFEVPSKNHLLYYQSKGLTMYDRNGQEFFKLNASGRRMIIPYQNIPPHVISALVAAEDRTFFTHHGISLIGIARAAYLDLRLQEFVFGGSTLTQQLTKTILLHPDKDINRKYQEAIYALKIDRTFSKEEILELYLNNAYFGEQAYGIEAAAQTYFKKPAAELTLAESTLLIGILPAPTTLSPISGNLKLAQQRQRYVLQQMKEEGYISDSDMKQAQGEPLILSPASAQANNFAHHFASAVQSALQKKFTQEYIMRSDMHVYTTLDPDWQKTAEDTLSQHLPTIQYRNATNGAVVVIDVPTREIRALIGSIDWHNNQFGQMNMATTPRQTGSAFKPIVYASGLESGQITAASSLNDKPTTFGQNYKPENYDKRYHGPVTVRYALANSLNIPAVNVASTIGPNRVAATARKLGVTSLSHDASSNLSIALGTEEISLLELTNAYAAFADEGQYQPVQFITRITDKYGQDIPWPSHPKQTVLKKETAYIISSILSDNKTRRPTFGDTLVTTAPSASKTGTTQKFRDAWTVGYTPHLAIGVWIGNNDFTPMTNAPGVEVSAPVWRSLTETLSAPFGSLTFNQPSTLVERYVCPRYGLLSSQKSGGIPEYFIPGTEPTKPCPRPAPSPTPKPDIKQSDNDQSSPTKKQPTKKPALTKPSEEASDQVNKDNADNNEETG